jgi:hypothetical protein
MADANQTPATDRFHPLLAKARKRIHDAIVEHCGTGADIESVAADAARDILGEIVHEAFHHYTGVEFDATDWRRLPPTLRAAIAKSIGDIHE